MTLERAGIRALSALAIVLSLSVTGALADISDVVLTFQASSGRSAGVLEITADQGTWDGDNFFWTAGEDMDIVGGGGEVLGTVAAGSHIELYADPQIAMGFSFQAGDADTDVTVTSALLSFPTIASAMARADAAFTVMDFMGSGASLTGLEPGGGAYRAYYNDSTTFTEAIDQIAVAPPDTLADDSFAYPGAGAYSPIGSVSNMGAEIGFTLSANAFASGSSNFEVVPEPAGLVLLVVGLGVLRRR
jgi:hypothetical protein